MAQRKLWLVTAVLALVAGAMLLSDHFSAPGGGARDKRVGTTLVANVGSLRSVDKVEVKKGDKTVVLVRDADQAWRLGDAQGFPAMAERVAQLFDSLAKARIETVVATKKAAFGDLGLNVPTIVTMTEGGKPTITLALGDARKNGGAYVAFDGEEKAYLVSEAVAASPDLDPWEFKTLLNLDKDQIKEVTFTPPPSKKGALAVTLRRDKKEDPLAVKDLHPGEKEAATVKGVEAIAANISFSKRYDVSNEEAKSAASDAAAVKIVAFDGKIYEIKIGTVGEKEKKSFIAISAPSDDPKAAITRRMMELGAFEVQSYIATRFDRQRSDFVETASTSTAPADKKSAPKAAPAKKK